MAQPGDFRLSGNVWQGFGKNNQWFDFPTDYQAVLSERYSGVTGTGSSQQFENIGWPETAPSRYESPNTVMSVLDASITRAAVSKTPTQAPSTVSEGPNPITDWAAEFLGKDLGETVVYPFKDRYGQYDADMMQQFVAWGKATGRFSKDDVAAGTAEV